MPQSNNIVVKVEVQMPSTNGAVQPRARTQVFGGRLAALLAGTTTVDTPIESAQTRVRVDTSGNYICSAGTSIDGQTPARYVFGKVYGGGIDPGNVPPQPPEMTRWVRPAVNGTWAFSSGNTMELPDVQCSSCGSGNGSLNTLVLWIDWGETDPEIKIINFQGCSDTQTECTGSGFSGMRMQVAGRAEPTAPRQWSIDVQDFPAPSAAFNGQWVLSQSGPGVWENEGEDEATTHVELRGPEDGAWRLTFRAGKTVATYTKPAAEWDPLGRNTFTKVAEVKPRRKVAPAVTVVPL